VIGNRPDYNAIMLESKSADEILFDVETPLGFRVRTTIGCWELIARIKHPVVRGRQEDIQETLRRPSEVRTSTSDAQVYLFYRSDGAQRWLCAVARRLNGEGFLITAYRTPAPSRKVYEYGRRKGLL